MKISIALLAAAVVCVFGYKYTTKPNSYEDCVLKNIDKANDKTAAYAVINSCRSMFPKGEISKAELDKIFGITN